MWPWATNWGPCTSRHNTCYQECHNNCQEVEKISMEPIAMESAYSEHNGLGDLHESSERHGRKELPESSSSRGDACGNVCEGTYFKDCFLDTRDAEPTVLAPSEPVCHYEMYSKSSIRSQTTQTFSRSVSPPSSTPSSRSPSPPPFRSRSGHFPARSPYRSPSGPHVQTSSTEEATSQEDIPRGQFFGDSPRSQTFKKIVMMEQERQARRSSRESPTSSPPRRPERHRIHTDTIGKNSTTPRSQRTRSCSGSSNTGYDILNCTSPKTEFYSLEANDVDSDSSKSSVISIDLVHRF